MADQGGGAAGARRRADDAGERAEQGRRRLHDMMAREVQFGDVADAARDDAARAGEWLSDTRDRAARMHDSAAALHDQAVLLGIGDEDDHRRRAARHRDAASANRPRPAADGAAAGPES